MADNLMSVKLSRHISKHDGFSSTILDSFLSPSTQPEGVTWDGVNIFSADSTVDTIYKHDGFSNTILDSFSSPSTRPCGLTIDQDGDLYSIDKDANMLYKHDGFSSTILDSFGSPSSNPTGIMPTAQDTAPSHREVLGLYNQRGP